MTAYEMQAREAKVAKMIETLRAGGITAAELSRGTELDWGLVADASHVKHPSEITKALVLKRLGELESGDDVLRCQRCQCEIKDGRLCDECREEEKFEEAQQNETGADRCPPRE